MEFSLIILRQTILMSLFMLIGYLLYRGKKIDAQGSKSIAALLVWAVIPANVVKSCLLPYSSERMAQMAQCFYLAAAVLMIAMVISRICFRKDPVAQFAASFSNAGFIGIPLVQASLGDGAVFFLIGIIILLNLLQWTYGAKLLKGESEKLRIKSILLNPVTISAVAGVGLFALRLGDRFPPLLTSLVSGVAALNTPLAMIVLGVYLAQTELGHLFTSGRLYFLSAVRLLLIPAVTIPVILLLPGTHDMKMTLMIAAAAPVDANVAVYSQLYNRNYMYACETVTQSTLLSILTLPLMCALAGMVLR